MRILVDTIFLLAPDCLSIGEASGAFGTASLVLLAGGPFAQLCEWGQHMAQDWGFISHLVCIRMALGIQPQATTPTCYGESPWSVHLDISLANANHACS